MTPAGFRRIALALDGAIESAHHGHPDFRVGGGIFATLGYPDKQCGVVMLTPEQQRQVMRTHTLAFAPVKGKWGEAGATVVHLAAVDEETLGETLTLAWQNRAARPERQPKGATARMRRPARARGTTSAPAAPTRRGRTPSPKRSA